MPSFPVHLVVANQLCEDINIRSKPDFFLGCIAPDSVNLAGFASQDERYGAHIRCVDYDKWKVQLTEFYESGKNEFAQRIDYLKGYLFHCVTDIAWDEAVQPQLFEFLQSAGELSREQLTKLKWEELFRFNSLLVRREDFKRAVGELEKAQPLDIATVSAQQVVKYRDYVVNDYKDKISSDPPSFLSSCHIELCAKSTKELFDQIIK